MQLDKKFTSKIYKGTGKASWSRVIMEDSVEFFGTKGYVKIKGTVDGYPFTTALMPMGDGTHMFPIRAEIRKVIGKDVGDTVSIHLTERLS